jgi:hypothetical protein
VDDKTCIFYECCVVRIMWGAVAKLTNWPEIVDFESMAKLWIRDKTLKIVNVLTTAVILCLFCAYGKLETTCVFRGHAGQGLEPTEQAGGGDNPGGMGVRVGTKKRKTTSA